MVIIPNGAMWQPPETSKFLAQAFRRTLARLDIPEKEAASLMGLDASQWNRQMHGRDGAHVSMFRVGWFFVQRPAALPIWIDEMVTLTGQGKYISDQQLCDLMNLAQRVLLETESGKKRMAKSTLETSEQHNERETA